MIIYLQSEQRKIRNVCNPKSPGSSSDDCRSQLYTESHARSVLNPACQQRSTVVHDDRSRGFTERGRDVLPGTGAGRRPVLQRRRTLKEDVVSRRVTVSMFRNLDIFAVPCSYCHARADEPCRTAKGRGETMPKPHVYRARRAVARAERQSSQT